MHDFLLDRLIEQLRPPGGSEIMGAVYQQMEEPKHQHF